MGILDLFSLEGKIAMVTGGGGGIGRGIALGLAEAGADVAVAGRREQLLKDVGKEIEDRGRRTLALPTDVRDWSNVEGLVQSMMDHFGRIDVWVSNAGGLQEQSVNFLVKTPEESWDATTTLNFKAPWMCAKAVWPAMRSTGGGSIINVSSVGALARGAPTNGVYTASKAGLNHLTKTLALEMAPFNIRVNAILPGSVRTEDYEDSSGGGDDYFEKMAEAEPLKRLGKEEDFGAAAVYLASDASSWVTGTLLKVAGHP
ncbi:MAG: SDR family NAD(P)-dependent oxidoreductase [Chloroflexi bacterium]|nr:SDR family NAD(P)-dependent oxidoreductase [Chloroflexota bacterium]